MPVLPDTARKIIKEIDERKFKPIYFLMGEEPYFIDKLASYIEENALSEADRSFNQNIHYGSEIDILTLVGEAKRFPMMSDYQLVMVKEGQLIKNLAGKDKGEETADTKAKDPFLAYCENPAPTTILVICFKGKTLDKRKALYKAIDKNGYVFNSEVIKDWNLAKWVGEYVKEKGFRIADKATVMMAEFLGNDLSKIENELSKLAIILPKGTEITEDIIEKNIGVSKEYNVFELQKAISNQDVMKANKIANYFIANPKENPPVVWIANLYGYFTKLLQIHYHVSRNVPMSGIAEKVGIHPFVFNEYEMAAKRYNYAKVSKNISSLRDLDMKLKGVDSGQIPESDLIREFIFKIIHTR